MVVRIVWVLYDHRQELVMDEARAVGILEAGRNIIISLIDHG